MNIFETDNPDAIDGLVESIEHTTGKKVFTMAVLDKDHDTLSLTCVIAFTDKTMMYVVLTPQEIDGKLVIRTQGKYL